MWRKVHIWHKTNLHSRIYGILTPGENISIHATPHLTHHPPYVMRNWNRGGLGDHEKVGLGWTWLWMLSLGWRNRRVIWSFQVKNAVVGVVVLVVVLHMYVQSHKERKRMTEAHLLARTVSENSPRSATAHSLVWWLIARWGTFIVTKAYVVVLTSSANEAVRTFCAFSLHKYVYSKNPTTHTHTQKTFHSTAQRLAWATQAKRYGRETAEDATPPTGCKQIAVVPPFECIFCASLMWRKPASHSADAVQNANASNAPFVRALLLLVALFLFGLHPPVRGHIRRRQYITELPVFYLFFLNRRPCFLLYFLCLPETNAHLRRITHFGTHHTHKSDKS